jgi:excinuclease ABC subunit A
VLDEPTIGLHPRDNQILLKALGTLGDKGNTLVVVEHDEDTIRRADHIIDIGPGAGKRGGRVVAQGTAAELAAQTNSHTGRELREYETALSRLAAPVARDPGMPLQQKLNGSIGIRGAREHNLKGIDVDIPRNRFTVVTGALDRPISLEFIGDTAYVVTLTGEIWTIAGASGPPFGVRR